MLNRNPKPRPRRWIPKKSYSKMTRAHQLKAKWHNDWVAVKALRKFVNGFDAKDGFNLNDVHEGRLSSAKKNKIRRAVDKYRAEVIAVNSGKYVLKHYYNRQTLADAVRVSQQESALGKNQRNAVFYTTDPDNFKVHLRRGKGFKGESRFVMSDSLFKMDRIRFDSPDFLAALQAKIDAQHKAARKRGRAKRIRDWTSIVADQPELVLETAMEFLPKRKRYSIMTGKYSTEPVRASEILAYFRNKIMQYIDEESGEFYQEIDFLTGIQALD